MLLLLLLSIRVTPLIFSDESTGEIPATTVKGTVSKVLVQMRSLSLLVQVYLSVPCVTTAQTSSELELLTIVSVDTVH